MKIYVKFHASASKLVHSSANQVDFSYIMSYSTCKLCYYVELKITFNTRYYCKIYL